MVPAVRTLYLPILEASYGNLKALARLYPSVVPRVLPVLEVPSDWSGGGPAVEVLLADVPMTAAAGLRLALDLHSLPSGSTDCADHPGYNIGKQLAAVGVPALPVISPGDDERAPLLRLHARTAELHGHGAVVRFSPPPGRWNDNRALVALARVVRRSGLEIGDCHLLIDLGWVGDGPLNHHVWRAGTAINWSRRAPWRTVALAAGSVPQDPLAAAGPTTLRLSRRELEIAGRAPLPGGLSARGFGDYGVLSPVKPRRSGRPPRVVPTLRYTRGPDIWVYRRPSAEGDYGPILALCRALLDDGLLDPYGEGFSWGDHEIVRRALGHTDRPGAARDWRAWGMSHHMTCVANELPGVAGTARAAAG